MREVIKQALTIEEAIELALEELNLTREQVTYEVLEYPEKKFLFGRKPAKVKVMQTEEEFSVKNLFEEPKAAKTQNKPQAKKEEKPALKEEKPQEKPAVKEEKIQEKPKAENEEKPEETKEEITEDFALEIPLDQAGAKVNYAMEFIKSVIDRFYTSEYSFKVFKTQTGYIIKIVGEDAGCLIGRKGETMEAISYLTSLAANRFEDSGEKISVDVADYRQKREKDLKAMAKKMALKVAKTGRNYAFEPMNPYERRVIHATVSEVNGVKSESKGEGSQRRVVIYSLNPRKHSPKGRKPFNRDKKPQSAPQKTRDEKLVDDMGAGLYSKIEL